MCDHLIDYVGNTGTWTYGDFHTPQLQLSAQESNQWGLLANYTLSVCMYSKCVIVKSTIFEIQAQGHMDFYTPTTVSQ